MNLKEEILREHSKAQCFAVVSWVGSDEDRFLELFHLFLNGEDIIRQRASWPLSYCVEAHPFLVKKHLDKLIQNLQQEKLHDAVKRNSLRLLQFVDIPEKYQGAVMNICFDYLASPDEAIAVKALSLLILGEMAKTYPDIMPELKLLIEDQQEHSSAAFKSCATRVLKILENYSNR
jgi:hypothetical protein